MQNVAHLTARPRPGHVSTISIRSLNVNRIYDTRLLFKLLVVALSVSNELQKQNKNVC